MCSPSKYSGYNIVPYRVLFTSDTYKDENLQAIVNDVLAIMFGLKNGQKRNRL